MISKKELLKNLQAYTPEQIAEEVRSGNVTLYELAKGSEGAFTPLLKKQVKEILNKPTEHPHLISEQRAPEQLEDSSYPKEQNLEISLPGSIQAEEMEQADGKQVEQHQFFSKIQEETQNTPYYSYEEVVDNRGMFLRPFNFFKGRIRRTEYWLSMFIFYGYAFTVGFVEGFLGITDNTEAIFYLLLIPGYWFLWAQGSKRCHDRGNTGWYQIIPFYFLWLFFADSEEGINEYGNNPKD